MTRNQRTTPAQWAQIIDDFEDSGKSKSRNCRQHVIGISTLDNWRRRLADSQGEVPAARFIQVHRQNGGDPEQVCLQSDNGVTLVCVQ